MDSRVTVEPGTVGITDVGLRERKKERTREALEAAALDLFERKGFDHTTVEEIADACDVSRRTFFRYFASKEEAFAGDKAEKSALVASLLAARPADEAPLESVRFVVRNFCAQMGRDKEATLRRLRIAAASHDLHQLQVESYDERTDGLVDALVARNGSPVDPETRLQMRLVIGAAMVVMRSAAEQWLASDGGGDLEDIVDRGFDLLAAGFRG
ncbi:MAG TPA: TetR family transcriptional regulator [Acidimicrobiia bacterium]|nr:TetR family transcriptional regulator [Acidimicrobiia bacterium]